MAYEAVLIHELEPAIPFTVADSGGIEKGALLKITDPMTAAASAANADVIAGIAASEKITNDGKVKLGVYRRGVFKMTATGAVVVGNPVMAGTTGANDDNLVIVAVGTLGSASGARTIGTALETVAAGETFLVDVNVGAAG